MGCYQRVVARASALTVRGHDASPTADCLRLAPHDRTAPGPTVTASTSVIAVDGEGVVELRSGEVMARFVPAAGLLGVSLARGGEEFLAMPGSIDGFRAGHTTGLPILHPWANRLSSRRFAVAGTEVDLTDVELHTDQRGLPIHGTLAGDARLGDHARGSGRRRRHRSAAGPVLVRPPGPPDGVPVPA